MRKLIIATSVVSALLGATSAYAENDPSCGDAPRSQWMTEEAVKAKVAEMGYNVHRVKVENGCYEVKGFDKNGNRAEVYVNPVSGDVVRNAMGN